MVHQIDELWQIDMMYMSKLSKHNEEFKSIMMVIDILSKHAWLELLNSKHTSAIKNTLEHILARQ